MQSFAEIVHIESNAQVSLHLRRDSSAEVCVSRANASECVFRVGSLAFIARERKTAIFEVSRATLCGDRACRAREK